MADDKRPQFGNRLLTDQQDVFQHNAWDNVVWNEDQQAIANKKVADNSSNVLDDQELEKYESNANGYWDKFYQTHLRDFFKDRHWLFTEFTELITETEANDGDCTSTVDDTYIGSSSKFKIFEIGCGVGNTIIPILQMNL